MIAFCRFCGLFLVLLNPLFAMNISWTKYKEETFQELPQFIGWCTKEKAEKLMDFMYEKKPKMCVEIGTFGGSTTFPMIRAIRFLGNGILYAIDAWDNKEAVEGLNNQDANRTWWSSVNLKEIQNNFFFLLTRKGLKKWCQPLVLSSEKALAAFSDESLDMIYIDGNFSPSGTMRDVLMSLKKVKKGGYIWLNDSHVEDKLSAVSLLMKTCEWLPNYSLRNCCIVFQKT